MVSPDWAKVSTMAKGGRYIRISACVAAGDEVADGGSEPDRGSLVLPDTSERYGGIFPLLNEAQLA